VTILLKQVTPVQLNVVCETFVFSVAPFYCCVFESSLFSTDMEKSLLDCPEVPNTPTMLSLALEHTK